MSQLIKQLATVLADTYTLYLKTQNYHWHIKGAQFKSLHELFEKQYQSLALAVDDLAERIIIKGHNAPATFEEYMKLNTIKEGNSSLKPNGMLTDLVNDHNLLIEEMQKAVELADAQHDSGTINLLDERIAEHEKMRWMLSASKDETLEN